MGKREGKPSSSTKPRPPRGEGSEPSHPPHRGQGRPSASDDPFDAAALRAILGTASRDVDVAAAMSIDLRAKALTRLPVNLGATLRSVRRLDLRGNHLTDLSALASLPCLSNLNVSDNARLHTLHTLRCSRLIVLAVADCGLISLRGADESATTLRTLIANDNDLELQTPPEQRADRSLPAAVRDAQVTPAALENYAVLSRLTACETIILTRNRRLCVHYPTTDDREEGLGTAAKEFSSSAGRDSEGGAAAKAERQREAALLAAAHPLSVFECMTQLRKLSLSDCGLTCLPARWFLPLVGELRLAQNRLRTLRPDGVIARSLKTLDVGHNALTTIATLRRCHYVQRIVVQGNPFVKRYVERDREERGEGDARAVTAAATGVPLSLQRSLQRLMPSLVSIDGQPLLSMEDLAVRSRRGEPRRVADDAPASDVSDTEADLLRPTTAAAAAMQAGTTAGSGGSMAAPAKRRRREQVTPAVVRAEADERDVVVEAPASVVRESQPSVVRRERTPTAVKKGIVLSGGAAVAKLLERKHEHQGW